MIDLKEVVRDRYSTKSFDSTKVIPDELFEQIKDLIRFSPSSINIQPWHFIVGNTEEGKARIAKGTQGFYIFNEKKILDASHVIVICSKTETNDEYMSKLLDKEDEDGRFANAESKEQMKKGRKKFSNIHENDKKDHQHWLEKQVYLNMGTLLLGAAALGIDAVPMEGIDAKALDQEFGLSEKGLSAISIVSLGYRSEDDFNAGLPKSRLAEEDIITVL